MLGAKCTSASAPRMRRLASSGQGADCRRSAARLHVRDRTRSSRRRRGRRHRRGRVALHEHDVRAPAAADVGDPAAQVQTRSRDAGRDASRRALVGSEPNVSQRPAQQLVVLPGRAEDRVESLARARRRHRRVHLDRLGPRAHDGEHRILGRARRMGGGRRPARPMAGDRSVGLLIPNLRGGSQRAIFLLGVDRDQNTASDGGKRSPRREIVRDRARRDRFHAMSEIHLFEPSGYAGVFQHSCRLGTLLSNGG